MIRNKGFEIVTIADENMAVPIGEEATAFHGVVALSASAAFLLNSLNEPHTANELIEILLKEYDVDRETAEKDIKEIVPKLIELGLIKE